MSATHLQEQIETILGAAVQHQTPLSGGMIGQVYQVVLADGRRVVAKVGDVSARLSIEGYMLRYLTEHSQLPVPEVLHSTDTLLLMTFVEGESQLSDAVQRHAAELLAALHEVTQSLFGLERDTLIGPLYQPNPLTENWIDFFREQRLLYMAHIAHEDGPLPAAMLARIERFGAQLENWLIAPDQPSLIHGDIWTTNVLTQDGRVTAFIDPAIYYGHAEIELAYTTLFGTFGSTFGSPFFDRYQALRPIAPGFFEERRHIYNLYPLLVHARLFGMRYVSAVDTTLKQFGY
jgi:fructosamine-3-kinase